MDGPEQLREIDMTDKREKTALVIQEDRRGRAVLIRARTTGTSAASRAAGVRTDVWAHDGRFDGLTPESSHLVT
jgi:hypothetical protein